jgi:ribosomal protein S18 acetylase RimI-like enzyme
MVIPMNAPPLADVRRLEEAEVPRPAAMFARAFNDDPLNVVLIPDPCSRCRAFARLVEPRLVRAVSFGHVFCIEEQGSIAGLAVWAPPGVRLDAPPALRPLPRTLRAAAPFGRAVVRVISGATREPRAAARYLRLRLRRRSLARAHGSAQWHLAGLATDPDLRGRGVARALLDHMLERSDTDQGRVWLETNYPGNVTLYERFGFRQAAHASSFGRLPDWWLMERAARQRPRPHDSGGNP